MSDNAVIRILNTTIIKTERLKNQSLELHLNLEKVHQTNPPKEMLNNISESICQRNR